MIAKYYKKTTNLKEIIREEEINKELSTKINSLENSLILNKRTIVLDKMMIFISLVSLIISMGISIPIVVLGLIFNGFTFFSLYQDKIQDKSNNKELDYLKDIYKNNNLALDKLRNTNKLTSNYVLDEEVEFRKEDKEYYLLNLEKKLLLITYFNKHKNKLRKLYLNSMLEYYLSNHNYNGEDIIFIEELIQEDLEKSKARIRIR